MSVTNQKPDLVFGKLTVQALATIHLKSLCSVSTTKLHANKSVSKAGETPGGQRLTLLV